MPLDVWGVDEFTPDGIILKGAIRTRPLQQWAVGRELNRRLQARYDELGIELARRQLAPDLAAQPA
jgi:small-conductance mechanosensitive channel